MIYLDNAATTPVRQEVVEAMIPYFTDKWYNPSSLYSKSKAVKEDIEKARKTIADFINAKNNEIYFTSGGSEANSWAIQGFANNSPLIVLTSNLEHHSIIACCENNRYIILKKINVNNEGFIDVSHLEYMLKECEQKIPPILVTIQLANNEIGTIQDIKNISNLVHKYNGFIHCDATQAFGHLPIDVKDLNVDMLTASGHKIGAPKGIGFLYIKDGIDIKPIVYGTQERNKRGGTENVPYIIGLAKAVECCDISLESRETQLKIRNYFIRCLCILGCKINGSDIYKLPNNINVTFPHNITGEALIYLLDTAGIYISSGSACNTYTNQPSHVLQAIGLSESEIMRTIRITLPDISNYDNSLISYDEVYEETVKQIDTFISEVNKALALFGDNNA